MPPMRRTEHASTRVSPVKAEAARVGMDVAEGVGQQEPIAVLEDLHRPEVGRLDDRHGRAGRYRTAAISSRASALIRLARRSAGRP